ncbi:hypothetical protein FJTKL_01763 [Diaporthe vaccinii]|uniref:Uncharacterized protein n=1 Tax=Diaporthe vaccinii TaxID=105482 RepID=A0ABR4F474_9PEZI
MFTPSSISSFHIHTLVALTSGSIRIGAGYQPVNNEKKTLLICCILKSHVEFVNTDIQVGGKSSQLREESPDFSLRHNAMPCHSTLMDSSKNQAKTLCPERVDQME